jgi:hypothetical protein
MSVTGNEGGFITQAEGTTMTSNFRAKNPGHVKAHLVGRVKLEQILAQEGCMGIRVYNGFNPQGERDVLLVGVDANNKDMLNLILDRTSPCPNYCDTSSSLCQ